MTPDKLNKYRKGNFELKSKHIYAKKKLENIRDYILLSHNLVGGNYDKSTFKNNTDIIADLINDNVNITNTTSFELIKNKITEFIDKNQNILLDSSNNILTNLITADTTLTDTFNKYKSNNNGIMDNVKDKDKVIIMLNNIQKNLFNLQAKIIFSSLKKIKEVDITELVTVINEKITAMNNYIVEQEKAYHNQDNDKGECDGAGEGKSVV